MGELVAQPESVGRNSLLDPLSSSPQPGLDACSSGGACITSQKEVFLSCVCGVGEAPQLVHTSMSTL